VYQTFTFDGFAGGINQRTAPDELADDEFVYSLNLELDRSGYLAARQGVSFRVATTTPITSLYYFTRSDGTETVLHTEGLSLYRSSPGSGTRTDITGAVTLPSGPRISWVTFNDVAIGATGSTSGTNPIKVVNTSSNAAALGGTPPKGLYAEVFNHRLWLVDAQSPNVVKCSALGNAEDWSTTGKLGTQSFSVGGAEGGVITGLKAHRGLLFVFKRSHVYVIEPGSPNTDILQYQIRPLSVSVGCVSHWTIQSVLDDLYWLSEIGVVSLSATQAFGDFRHAVVSDNILDLTSVPKNVDCFASVVLPHKSQYWLSVPTSTSGGVPENVWVLDYSRVATSGGSKRPWVLFGQGAVGRAYAVVRENNEPRLYIAYPTNSILFQDPSAALDDYPEDNALQVYLITKAYTLGSALQRKEFYRFAVEVSRDSAFELPYLFVKYRFDARLDRGKHFGADFPTAAAPAGAKWDVDLWNVGLFAEAAIGANDRLFTFQYPFRGRAGRRGRSVQFAFAADGRPGLSFRKVAVDAALLRSLPSPVAGYVAPPSGSLGNIPF
jgi:hypothetical protein